ncbi:MAG: zinc-binding dehydrogenase, partial [Pseudomonadota bacterium]|nr:zinc-binding dehydrogenase [Pseudomonadota bacterium]
RPTLMSYTATRADIVAAADDLFAAVGAGHVNISVEQRFALADTRAAHEALEARQTTGSTILLP